MDLTLNQDVVNLINNFKVNRSYIVSYDKMKRPYSYSSKFKKSPYLLTYNYEEMDIMMRIVISVNFGMIRINIDDKRHKVPYSEEILLSMLELINQYSLQDSKKINDQQQLITIVNNLYEHIPEREKQFRFIKDLYANIETNSTLCLPIFLEESYDLKLQFQVDRTLSIYVKTSDHDDDGACFVSVKLPVFIFPAIYQICSQQIAAFTICQSEKAERDRLKKLSEQDPESQKLKKELASSDHDSDYDSDSDSDTDESDQNFDLSPQCSDLD